MAQEKGKKRLRSGFTTGACAAAAAKAAVLALYGLTGNRPGQVDIPFPGGERHGFVVCRQKRGEGSVASASVIKDAGDDPDVTNGAEIIAEVAPGDGQGEIRIAGGPGVGLVTKPGLPIPPGEPAINPVPRQMIRAAATEALALAGQVGGLDITIAVRDGEALAERTLNRRLGIVGGLSILGTTGIVRPVSAKAWTDTIEVCMSVARAAGLDAVLLSTGRTSEAAVQRTLRLPSEARVMMGDYLCYSLQAASRHGFHHIHLAGMWGKVIKAALEIPQTHVRHGELTMQAAAALLQELGLPAAQAALCARANTSREIYGFLRDGGRMDLVRAVCLRAREYARRCSGLPVTLYLVGAEEGVVLYV